MVEFSAGDVVQLISGGPAMTVKIAWYPTEKRGEEEQKVVCVYFDKRDVAHEDMFASNLLKMIR
jgi:uncharacterized protein YodC (DUF2158 family)